MLVPISEAHHAYAEQVLARLKAAGIRARADLRSEKMNYKIREAQVKKVPYMLVMGDREAEAATVAVRTRRGESAGVKPVDDFIAEISGEIRARSL
jgi:threonyl-tRNA synthetase